MSKPDWKDAPEWAEFLAKDNNGNWNWFEREPVMAIDRWRSANPYDRRRLAKESDLWVKTLERRP